MSGPIAPQARPLRRLAAARQHQASPFAEREADREDIGRREVHSRVTALAVPQPASPPVRISATRLPRQPAARHQWSADLAARRLMCREPMPADRRYPLTWPASARIAATPPAAAGIVASCRSELPSDTPTIDAHATPGDTHELAQGDSAQRSISEADLRVAHNSITSRVTASRA